jgi:hypothetical protein
VRLFFTSAELSALMAVDPSVAGIGSLSVTKYNGPTEDGTYNPSDATSLTWYPSGSMITGSMYGGLYLEFTITSFSEFWIHGGTGVLPIELIAFDANVNSNVVDLNWATASETNNDYFTIERSQDGLTFESIDTIDGAGNSTTLLVYFSTDAHPHEGLSYYRLKQVDFNGHFSYSEWRAVNITGASVLSVYPNPCDGQFSLILPGAQDVMWTLRMSDVSGKIVYARNGAKSEMSMHNAALEAGTYILTISSESIILSEYLIITGQ